MKAPIQPLAMILMWSFCIFLLPGCRVCFSNTSQRAFNVSLSQHSVTEYRGSSVLSSSGIFCEQGTLTILITLQNSRWGSQWFPPGHLLLPLSKLCGFTLRRPFPATSWFPSTSPALSPHCSSGAHIPSDPCPLTSHTPLIAYGWICKRRTTQEHTREGWELSRLCYLNWNNQEAGKTCSKSRAFSCPSLCPISSPRDPAVPGLLF